MFEICGHSNDIRCFCSIFPENLLKFLSISLKLVNNRVIVFCSWAQRWLAELFWSVSFRSENGTKYASLGPLVKISQKLRPKNCRHFFQKKMAVFLPSIRAYWNKRFACFLLTYNNHYPECITFLWYIEIVVTKLSNVVVSVKINCYNWKRSKIKANFWLIVAFHNQKLFWFCWISFEYYFSVLYIHFCETRWPFNMYSEKILWFLWLRQSVFVNVNWIVAFCSQLFFAHSHDWVSIIKKSGSLP